MTLYVQIRLREYRSAMGFTLIELLVVIAILGILASLILPSLSAGKNQAVETMDINNLKQIITATQMYASDNGDVLPWPNWLAGDSPTREGWLYTLNNTVSGPARFIVTTGFFWNTLKNSKLYMCPMDGPGTLLFSERDQQISSYAMNGAVIGYERTNFPAAKLASMLPNDVAFWETDEKDPKYFNDGANYPKEGVSARHLNGAINAAFGGTVTYIRISTWYVEVDDTNKNNLWCYPGSVNGR